MLAFVARRLLVSVFLILGLLTLVFFVSHLAPGDPLQRYAVGEVDAATLAHLERQFGLDQPLPVQYGRWLRSFLFDFDFGVSIGQRRAVRDIVLEALPYTLRLAAAALAVRLLLGVTLGVVAALRRGRRTDLGLGLGALLVYSIPSFWLGLMLLLLFSWQLQWLPSGQAHRLDAASLSWAARVADSLLHLLLPVFVLGVGGAASIFRFARAGMIEVLSQDYVRAARARGLRERTIVLHHALRNALLPVVTLVGLSIPALVGGTVVIESLFSWPGLGRLTVDAIGQRDYPVIMATTFLAGVTAVAGSLLADLLASWLDPRIRMES
ncbi:MAG TPA: ABC transporter permease [Candidatus Krumholzibacteria bacterium]|nr:ABC transporter permease [Candidatus Krumholzibacteria bacterium]